MDAGARSLCLYRADKKQNDGDLYRLCMGLLFYPHRLSF